uniref:DUF3459 domain-containing protein n=1 Tax=Erwinia citreus TaxID=558 RepID=UPI0028998EB4
IVPLLATAGGNSGKVLQTDTGFVAVSWTFPQGTLSIALNIGEKTQPLPTMPGETIFSWPPALTELPQHAILVRLAPGENA